LIGSAIFTVSSCLVTLVVTRLSTVIAITGGIGAVALCYIIPLYAFYKVTPKNDCELMLSLLLGSVLIIIELIAALHPLFL